MLNVPPEWNKVPDFTMEEEDVLPEIMGSNKWRRRDEISQGRQKGRKEDNIQ